VITAGALRSAVESRTDQSQRAWLDDALDVLARNPAAIRAHFPAVGRRVGRGPLDPGASGPFDWTVDDAARTLLLVALGPAAAAELPALYRHGDAAERRGLLRALPFLAAADVAGTADAADDREAAHAGDARDVSDVTDVAEAAVPLVADALRTNDQRLVAAALGAFAFAHLDDDAVAQAVLKCVFVGIPLASLEGLDERVTPALSRMLAAYAHERIAAGRTVPAEIWPLVDRHPPEAELAAIAAELEHPVAGRRAAAGAALADRAALAEHGPKI